MEGEKIKRQQSRNRRGVEWNLQKRMGDPEGREKGKKVGGRGRCCWKKEKERKKECRGNQIVQ
jgi:hypothetical protein